MSGENTRLFGVRAIYGRAGQAGEVCQRNSISPAVAVGQAPTRTADVALKTRPL
jgi:hypothetical protein